jgi:hypothetical protein
VEGGQLLDQGELHAIAAHTFDPAEPYSFAVAQLIELAWFSAKHAPQVVRRFSAKDRGAAFKTLDKESPAHALVCYINLARFRRPTASDSNSCGA